MAYVHDGLFIILPPYTGSSLPSGDNGGQEASTPLPTSGNGGKGEELVLWGKLLYVPYFLKARGLRIEPGPV